MDIAYYISDLLGQQGELTVPNLGYFVQIRKAAYYDNQAKKFFPPHYSVQFDPQVIDEDDSLANHITGVKNISLASAKYFIEKYIANLKSQAVVEHVPFANLGSFSSDGLKLTFNSGTKMDDPAFFAFQPLDVYKIGDTKVKKPVGKSDFLTEAPAPVAASAAAPPVTPAAIVTPPPTLPEPVVAPAEEAEEYYEEEPRRVFGVWMIVLIVLVLLVAGLGALYKFKPDVFNKIIPLHKKDAGPSAKSDSPAAIYHKKDSLARLRADSLAAVDAAKRDSTAKADSAANASVKPAAKPEVKQPEAKPEVKKTEVKPEVKQPEVKKPEAKKPEVVADTKKPATTVVTTQATAQKPITANFDKATASGDMPADIPRGWYIITAFSSGTKGPGERMISEMKSRGFVQARFATTKVGQAGNYLVILGAYPAKQDAVDRMKELKATGKITDSEMSLRKF